MSDELDNRLKKRITEVFDNYEDDDSAHEGWLLLREKLPEKKKDRAIGWLWRGSVAAILLVVLFTAIVFNNNSNKPEKVAGNTTISHSSAPGEIKNTNNNAVSQLKTKSTVGLPNDTINTVAPSAQIAVNNLNHTNLSKNTLPNLVAKNNQLAANYVSAIHNKKTDLNAIAYSNRIHTAQVGAVKSQEIIINNTNQLANAFPAPTVDTALLAANINIEKNTKTTTGKPVIKNDFAALLAKPIAEKVPEKIKPDNKVEFGVYAATYFNYAKGSDNEFNLGAGVSSEIKLTSRLKLLTGLAINQNSLNYKSVIPQSANQYLSVAIAAKSRYAADAAPVSNVAANLIAAAPVVPVLKTYQANLVGLDVPVNLKYQFGKSDNFISAGLSSGTYINETYQYAYSYTGNAYVQADEQNDKTQSSFNTFDFARTLNVSFGIGYPMGKTNRLIIEPFVKYPLSGLGTQQIHFGAGGVNLKFSFNTVKK